MTLEELLETYLLLDNYRLHLQNDIENSSSNVMKEHYSQRIERIETICKTIKEERTRMIYEDLERMGA